MARFGHPAPFPMREPEPSDRVPPDSELVQLYAEAKTRYLAGERTAALELYVRLADRAPFDGRVSHFVGLLHLWGVGAQRDTDQAEQWFQRAVVRGDNYAFLSLYKVLKGGGGVWRIPLGALKYMWAPLKMARVLWRDAYDERVIW